MEQAHARHDLPTYYRVNRAIHDRINAVAGNPILTHSFKTLNARLHALRFRSNLVQAKWDHAVKEHREMIKALAARTATGCATCWSGTCVPSCAPCWRPWMIRDQ